MNGPKRKESDPSTTEVTRKYETLEDHTYLEDQRTQYPTNL